MENLSVEEQRLLQEELGPGEDLLWAGKPNPRVIFHEQDWLMIPSSLAFIGFAASRLPPLRSLTKSDWPQILFDVLFFLASQHLLWGRFVYAEWKKTRVFYAITTQRSMIYIRPPNAKVASNYFSASPSFEVSIRRNGIGTLKFGKKGAQPANPRNTGSEDDLFLAGGYTAFVDIDNAREVAAIAQQQLRKVQQTRS